MNIVIIPAFFQTKSRKTLGSFFLEQARALQKKGHKVTILYCDTYSIKCVKDWFAYNEEKSEIIEGIQVYRNRCFCPLKHGIVKPLPKVFRNYMINICRKTDRISYMHIAVYGPGMQR